MDLGLGSMLSEQLSSDEDSLLIDQQTETAILQGDSLALAVIQQLGLASEPPFGCQTRGGRRPTSGARICLDEATRRQHVRGY